MKNDSLKKVFSAIAVTAVAVSATSVTAFADARNGLTDDEIEASAVKPKITASQITLTLDEAKDIIANNDGLVEWSISIEDANKEYCSTGMHVYYDERLSIATDPDDDEVLMINLGKAGRNLSQAKELDNENAADYPAHKANVMASKSDKTAGMKGFFVTTAGQENNGYNGQLWDVTVKLPSDVEAGALFPIDIVYKSVGGVADVFLDIDRSNLAMQAYAFTKGIYNEDNLNPNEPLEGTPYDGYILIEPGEEETTTTTTTTETTTTTTTTTTQQQLQQLQQLQQQHQQQQLQQHLHLKQQTQQLLYLHQQQHLQQVTVAQHYRHLHLTQQQLRHLQQQARAVQAAQATRQAHQAASQAQAQAAQAAHLRQVLQA